MKSERELALAAAIALMEQNAGHWGLDTLLKAAAEIEAYLTGDYTPLVVRANGGAVAADGWPVTTATPDDRHAFAGKGSYTSRAYTS